MTQRQHPIGRGFTAASTADDILRSVDLSGANVIDPVSAARLWDPSEQLLKA